MEMIAAIIFMGVLSIIVMTILILITIDMNKKEKVREEFRKQIEALAYEAIQMQFRKVNLY